MAIDPAFRAALLRHGLLIEGAVPGIYGTGARFEAVVAQLETLLSALGAGLAAEVMRFPPVMPRAIVEQSGYVQAFPHLLGTVHCFAGGDAAHLALVDQLARGGDGWLAAQRPTDSVLTPACCYPVYSAVAGRGQVPPGGHVAEVQSWCFRHEPSPDPARMQAFRQREFVCMGAPAATVSFRQAWQGLAQDFLQRLGLPHRLAAATDPFFGWHGEVLATLQRDSGLKNELLVPVADAESWTACVSFNLHGEHFSRPCDLRQAGGDLAHTACVGFGLERLALALFRHHGFQLDPSALQ
jgi:seryl-tRNA synthetase